MTEAELSVRRIAEKHHIYTPLSIKSDVLTFGGGMYSISLREKLAQMQLPFVDDVKYCNPNRLDEFDVHFVVIAPTHDSSGNPYYDQSGQPLDDRIPTADNILNDPQTGPLSGADVFRREVEILNEYFVMEDETGYRNPVSKYGLEIQFRYKSHHHLEDIRQTGETLLEYGRQEDWQKLCQDGYPAYYGSGSGCWIDDIWACNDRRLYDPLAINIYIFDNMVPDCTNHTVDPFDNCSYGNLNQVTNGSRKYRPYIMLDLDRLFHNHLSPEEHEMGHVFGLRHNCDPSIRSDTDHSNIMQSSRRSSCTHSNRPTAAGDRGEGFGIIMFEERYVQRKHNDGETLGDGEAYDQVGQIIKTALKLQRYWGEVYRSRWPDV